MAGGADFLKGMLAGTLSGVEQNYQSQLAVQQKQDFEQWRLDKQRQYAELMATDTLDRQLKYAPILGESDRNVAADTALRNALDPRLLQAGDIASENATRREIEADTARLNNPELNAAKTRDAEKQLRDTIAAKIGTYPLLAQAEILQVTMEHEKAAKRLGYLQEDLKTIDPTDIQQLALFDAAMDTNLANTLNETRMSTVSAPYVAGMANATARAHNLAINGAINQSLDEWDESKEEMLGKQGKTLRDALESNTRNYMTNIAQGPEGAEGAAANMESILDNLNTLAKLGEASPLQNAGGLLNAVTQSQDEAGQYLIMTMNGNAVVPFPGTKAAAKNIYDYSKLPEAEQGDKHAWLDLAAIRRKQSNGVNSIPEAPPVETAPPVDTTPANGPGFSGAGDFTQAPVNPQQSEINPPDGQALLAPEQAPQQAQAPAPTAPPPDTEPLVAPVEDPAIPMPVAQAQPVDTGGLLADELGPAPPKPYEFPNYALPAADDLEGNKVRFVDDMVAAAEGASLSGKSEEEIKGAFKAFINRKIDQGVFPEGQEQALFQELWSDFLSRMRAKK